MMDTSHSEKKRKTRENERLARRIKTWRKRIEREVAGIDPHDLELILWSLLRPKKDRRFFIREVKKGMYVV